MGGHIPVKNKRARENSVSQARFIFSEGNILPPLSGRRGRPSCTGSDRGPKGRARYMTHKSAGIGRRDEGFLKKHHLSGQKSR